MSVCLNCESFACQLVHFDKSLHSALVVAERLRNEDNEIYCALPHECTAAEHQRAFRASRDHLPPPFATGINKKRVRTLAVVYVDAPLQRVELVVQYRLKIAHLSVVFHAVVPVRAVLVESAKKRGHGAYHYLNKCRRYALAQRTECIIYISIPYRQLIRLLRL